jgi:hypothetical protein
MTGTHPLTAAIVAARANDFDGLRRLVDWPLTGAGRMVRALAGVFERDRSGVLVTGLAELETAADRPEITAEVLAEAAPSLAAGREIRRADPAAAQAALAVVRVPAPPSGLTAEQHARLTQLVTRAGAVHEVLVVVSDTGELPVAMAPDTGLLVLLLPDKRLAVT